VLECGDVGRTAVTWCADGGSCGPKRVAVCDVALQCGAGRLIWLFSSLVSLFVSLLFCET
jgi:hypothetical protein